MRLSSPYTLHIADKETNDQYVLSRKRSMMFISFLILLARIIIGLDLLIRFSLHAGPSFMRMISFESGLIVHLVWIVLYWRFPLHLYKFNAFVVMVSFQFFLMNNNNDLGL
jgi:hypothetical protein